MAIFFLTLHQKSLLLAGDLPRPQGLSWDPHYMLVMRFKCRRRENTAMAANADIAYTAIASECWYPCEYCYASVPDLLWGRNARMETWLSVNCFDKSSYFTKQICRHSKSDVIKAILTRIGNFIIFIVLRYVPSLMTMYFSQAKYIVIDLAITLVRTN